MSQIVPGDTNASERVRSRPMRCFLVASPSVEHLRTAILHQFDGWWKPKKADNKEIGQMRRDALRLLLLNLIVFSWSDQNLWIQTPANKTWYTKNRFWLPNCVTKATIGICRDFLLEMGYAEVTSGKGAITASFRRNAAIKASQTFRALIIEHDIERTDIARSTSHDLIHLKAGKPKTANASTPSQLIGKRRVPFEMNSDLQSMIDNLTLINEQLRRAQVDIKLTVRQERDMMARIVKKQDNVELADDETDLVVDRTQDCCHRVFNNNTFDDGGRFYGPWWQSIPKEYRKHIMINGKRTVELDYSSMHPTILGHRLGITVADNFYEIGIGTKDVVKRAFNALLNARKTWVKPVDGFDEEAFGMEWTPFLRAVKKHYKAFKSYFGTGEGLKLQRIDSDIAEAVMVHFANKGQVILPVHDSFLVTEDMEQELAAVMEAEFYRATGGTIKLSDKRLDPEKRAMIGAKRRRRPDAYAAYFGRARKTTAQ